MHHIATGPNGWSFNNDVNKPTFGPSVKVSGLQKNITPEGKWDGWIKDADGKPIDSICHYFLCDGKLNYCGDCTHEFNGKQGVPLPEIPEMFSDEKYHWS
jgi:hypothetical protein